VQPDAVRPRPPRSKGFPWPTFVVTGGAALIAIGVFIGVGASKRNSESNAAAVPRASAAPSVAEPAAPAITFDPDEAYARARSEASKWHSEAVLAAMEIGPFQGGKVTPTGQLEAWFGKPAGAAVGPGSGLAKQHLVITVTPSALTQRTENRAGSVGLADPNCIVQDVWKEVLPSVVAHDARLTLGYALRSRDRRAIWNLLPEGKKTPLRVLDGNSCAFLVQ
jgi:hypothetical protein